MHESNRILFLLFILTHVFVHVFAKKDNPGPEFQLLCTCWRRNGAYQYSMPLIAFWREPYGVSLHHGSVCWLYQPTPANLSDPDGKHLSFTDFWAASTMTLGRGLPAVMERFWHGINAIKSPKGRHSCCNTVYMHKYRVANILILSELTNSRINRTKK